MPLERRGSLDGAVWWGGYIGRRDDVHCLNQTEGGEQEGRQSGSFEDGGREIEVGIYGPY